MPTVASQQPTDVELVPVTSNHAPTSDSGAPRKVSNQTVKSEKTVRSVSQPTPKQPQQPAIIPQNPSQMKRLTRKSSKPIINWFQRKLAGTVRSRRASDADALRAQRAVAARPVMLKDQHRRSSVPAVPPLPPIQTNKKGNKSMRFHTKPPPEPHTKRNTISLDGSDDFSSLHDGRTIDSSSEYRSSLARESMWSPTSMSVREADEDASVRPIPPSIPPSPSPSHSSSSYLSDPRTFASMAASTKPTTLLSVDLTGGMAHIAQAPPTPTHPSYRLSPHARTHSATPSTVGSITFSALPTAGSRPTSSTHGASTRMTGPHSLNAPQHTTHHPRNNPRPSSPPLDDASVLTLASSAFGIPYARMGANALTGRRSLADDSISHISGVGGMGDSVSHFLSGELDGDDDRLLMEGDRDGDVDASVRALRPRSSRRGSWESEASGWSAHLAGTPGTPSALRDRSLWTSPSIRTGGRSLNVGADDDYGQEKSDLTHEDDRSFAFTTSEAIHEDDSTSQSVLAPHSDADISTPSAGDSSSESQSHITPSLSSTSVVAEGNGTMTPKREKEQETPKVSTLVLEDAPPVPLLSNRSSATAISDD